MAESVGLFLEPNIFPESLDIDWDRVELQSKENQWEVNHPFWLEL